jgi:hypothetical protein
MPLPAFEDWLKMPEAERVRVVSALDAYAGEGQELLDEVWRRFRAEYGHVHGVQTYGPGANHGGTWAMSATTPFIFDRRSLPVYYLGVHVKWLIPPPLPAEFQNGYPWAPQNYERFVDRCAAEIREVLGKPDMTREEMLHALIGRPFEEHAAR